MISNICCILELIEIFILVFYLYIYKVLIYKSYMNETWVIINNIILNLLERALLVPILKFQQQIILNL